MFLAFVTKLNDRFTDAFDPDEAYVGKKVLITVTEILQEEFIAFSQEDEEMQCSCGEMVLVNSKFCGSCGSVTSNINTESKSANGNVMLPMLFNLMF
jgi:hypothetical protein